MDHLIVLNDVLVKSDFAIKFKLSKSYFSWQLFLALGLHTKILSSMVRVDISKVSLHRSNVVLLSLRFSPKLH